MVVLQALVVVILRPRARLPFLQVSWLSQQIPLFAVREGKKNFSFTLLVQYLGSVKYTDKRQVNRGKDLFPMHV